MISREEILSRARACIGHGTYKLGRGGFDPKAPWPWATNAELCDCTGFLSWCIREHRENPAIDGGWIETTAIVADARGPQKLFAIVDAAVPGDILVYGDHRVRVGPTHSSYVQGHVGILASLGGTQWKTVIHCSHGNFEHIGHAVAETGVNVFTANLAIAVRYLGAQ